MLLSDVKRIVTPSSVKLVEDREILGLCYDSRQVVTGGLFFALKGTSSDGHQFIDTAVKAGAVAVVLEDESFAPAGAGWFKVEDARAAMALVAGEYYGNPTRLLKTVGVTGTNGKTTTTYLVESIMESAGIPTAVIGTVAYRFAGRTIPAPHTTPESVELQKILREMADMGAQGVAMEVSSHALEQHRVDACLFDVGLFTNLTREHLDYHGDMEGYFAAKARLFSELLDPVRGKKNCRAVINIDDPYGERMADAAVCPVIRFGMGNNADVRAEGVVFSADGITGTLVTPQGNAAFTSALVGRFNLANILGAVASGMALDIPLAKVVAGIESAKKVPGRLERVDNELGVTILVDYAHTGDALDNVLRTIREVATGRLITVFGCGGDRDPGKRPVMGALAARFSDLTIVTSDNPRTEDPRAIIEQIVGGIRPLGVKELSSTEVATGFSEKGYTVIESRAEAIRTAINAVAKGDIILIAGKGHEDYQIIGTQKHHFDDREEASRACATRAGRGA
jgi:UDP-N-acetylmuramoyl-L-alanyl-D-glutamate--2,6-diaminopimelate ligase